MNPGRELDALIAERVVGLEVTKEWLDDENEEEDYFLVDSKGNFKWTNPVPEYSTSIEAAWEIVDSMRERYSFFIESWPSDSLWSVQLVNHKMDKRYPAPPNTFRSQAKTVPHAICKAALAAVEGK